MIIVWILVILASVAAIVWGAETFAEHLGMAAVRLRVNMFALSLLLAGAEPEELATAIAAAVKDVPGIAFGDVIGANIAICLVALGVGAFIAPLPFGQRVRRYALFSVPIGAIATAFVWDGRVSRFEGAVLVGFYILYVAVIWIVERHPPTLGETEEIEEAEAKLAHGQIAAAPSRVSQDLLLVLAGLVAMAIGATLLVEAVRQISSVEVTQTKLGLTLVGFATAFELVVLAWSSARRGIAEAVVAGVVGSFAYNITMTLGMAAVIRPLQVLDAVHLHLPLLLLMAALLLVIGLALPKGELNRIIGTILLVTYPVVVVMLLMG